MLKSLLHEFCIFWTDEGWLYLAVVLDLFARVVVGWSMADRMTITLVADARRI